MMNGSAVSFDPSFLDDHTGAIVRDPTVALLELIANAYDAGATEVEITWPKKGQSLAIVRDNGVGMSADEFRDRWTTLSYNRRRHQGPRVRFPDDLPVPPVRLALGKNGKGRLAPFCFATRYFVETDNGKERTSALVDRTQEPFHVGPLRTEASKGCGTTIRFENDQNAALTPGTVIDTILKRFVSASLFKIFVNGEEVKLEDLKGAEVFDHPGNPDLEVPSFEISVVRASGHSATTALRGIAYRVGDRIVGNSNWRGLDGAGNVLDGRTTNARTMAFIVQVPFLESAVLADWTGFNPASELATNTQRLAVAKVEEYFSTLNASTYKDRKRNRLKARRIEIEQVSPVSQVALSRFLDRVQKEAPKISDATLDATISAFLSMEQARSGYEIMVRLARTDPHDIDAWNSIMSGWSGVDAEMVLELVATRLKLIEELSRKVNDKTADEVHLLMPLFQKGLWMFGPQFESLDYTMNRWLTTTLGKFVSKEAKEKTITPENRADFVLLPDRSLSVFTRDRYDELNEVSGVAEVLVVELKRGGFRVGHQEMSQAMQYCQELVRGGLVTQGTSINAIVLGSTLDPYSTGDSIQQETLVRALSYETILKRASARMFLLETRLKQENPALTVDEDLPVGPTDLYSNEEPIVS